MKKVLRRFNKMTQYDAHEMYREQIEKNKVSAIEANNGLITYYFKDGTKEIWKRNKLNRLYKFKKREQ